MFSPYAILPIISAFAYSFYAIVTRFVGKDEDVWTSLFYTAAFGAVILSIAVPFFWVPPPPTVIGLMLAIGVVGAAGHFCLIRAFTLTEASLLAPFSYVGLLFAIVWGISFFDEYPDILTYFGAFVIIAAGIYVWHRETQASKVPAP